MKRDPNDTHMLIGALSNDLFRIANLTQRGSFDASVRFIQESKKSTALLLHKNLPDYIEKIVKEIDETDEKINLQKAEKFLMYGILLQNFCLHYE